MKIQQHDGVVVDAAELWQGFAVLYGGGGGLGGEREAPGAWGAAALPPPSIYRVPKGGPRPWRSNLPRGRRPRGVECPPKASGAPHTLGFPTLGAGGRPKGGAPAH